MRMASVINIGKPKISPKMAAKISNNRFKSMVYVSCWPLAFGFWQWLMNFLAVGYWLVGYWTLRLRSVQVLANG